jgi:hypothetical protein
MNKKQYFISLWTLYIVFVVVGSVFLFVFGFVPTDELAPVGIRPAVDLMTLVVTAMASILIYGFVIAMGLDFAEKIGARLLLLNGKFDFKEDVFKPAVGVGTVYAGVHLLANALLVKFFAGVAGPESLVGVLQLLPLHMFSDIDTTELFLIFCSISMRMFRVIFDDIVLLLLIVSGITLFLKKIIRGISTSKAMLIAITLSVFLSGLNDIRLYGFSMLAIIPLVETIRQAALGGLFWKKGFETAVFCHLTIVFILYVIVPAVVFVLGI